MFEGSAAEFHCTNQGKNPVIDGVDDVQEMQVTRKAFSLLGKMTLLVLFVFIIERESHKMGSGLEIL